MTVTFDALQNPAILLTSNASTPTTTDNELAYVRLYATGVYPSFLYDANKIDHAACGGAPVIVLSTSNLNLLEYLLKS